MTSGQKKNQERFKRVVKRAGAIRRANPRLSQGEAVKKAWAELKRGKVSGSAKPAAKRKPVKAKKTGSHKDTNSHNVKISVVSGISLSEDEKKFLQTEGKKSKGYKYRAKLLWGDFIVLKETEAGTPLKKWIVDDFEKAQFLASELNKGQSLSKVKTVKRIYRGRRK